MNICLLIFIIGNGMDIFNIFKVMILYLKFYYKLYIIDIVLYSGVKGIFSMEGTICQQRQIQK